MWSLVNFDCSLDILSNSLPVCVIYFETSMFYALYVGQDTPVKEILKTQWGPFPA